MEIIYPYKKSKYYKSLIKYELTSWTKCRNEVIHELAKVEADKFIPFHEKKEKAKIVAESGLKLLRKLDNRTTSLRRRKK